MKRIIIALLTAAAFANGAVVLADYKTEYPWAAKAVEFCMSKNYLNGDGNGNLMLGDNITQAQMATIIARAFNIEHKTMLNRVSISSSHWAYTAVEDIADYLLLPAAFYADEPATREQYASTLVSVLGIPTVDDTSVLKGKFKDCSKIRLEYFPYLTAAYEAGIINGTDDSHINPKGNLTRAEAVTMLYRALAINGDVPKETSEYTTQKSEPAATPTQAPVDTSKVSADIPVSSNAILGKSIATCSQAKAWAKANGAAQRYIDIADIYWKYGDLTGIRADVLYVQAGKETGYGQYQGRVTPDMNNWAGIKRYGMNGDATEDHESFATPDDGVRAHFNHMSAYVGTEPVGTPHARYYSVKSLDWAGTVKTVEELGGKWCPDPQYGYDIMNMINVMLGY